MCDNPVRRFIQLALLAALVTTAPAARSQTGEAEFARNLVQATYYEGLPYSRARELTPAGVDVLIEMLADPYEAEYYENVVMALGISGAPQVFGALVEFSQKEVAGEVGAAEYRARRALPLAMGHLAGTDPRALQFLLTAARREESGTAQRWSYLYLRGQKLAGILRRAAITGVAMSGRPEAVAALQDLRERARLDPNTNSELRTHIREAQSLCDRVAREGPDRIFDSKAAQ